MKRYFKTLLCAGVLGVVSATSAFGVPAKRQLLTVVQPDGTEITLTQKGDEFFHYFQTPDGYIVNQDADGWYRIVGSDGALTAFKPEDLKNRASNLLTSGLAQINPKMAFEALRDNKLQTSTLAKTARKAPRKAAAASKWDNSDGHDLRDFPCEGEQNVLVILVNFSDKKWSFASNPQKEMTRILNEPGYSDLGFAGSAYDYFQKSSNGIFKPKFDVYGPVELSNSVSYYGRNDSYGEDVRPWDMVKDACKLLDSQVDFSKYDRNNDGYVDNIYVFYAGYGESDGGASSTIWPHAFELKEVGACPKYDGVYLNKYACSNELNYYRDSSKKEMSGIGTFCHEFSHVLGLPDIYSVSYNDAFTPGDYTLMDMGSYNNNGRTPPTYSIYERYALEWQKPVDLTEAGIIAMLPMTQNGYAYKVTINPSDPTEYYLFENRQNEGWDEYLPGHGMLVWHIDFDASIWAQNVVNDTPSHQYIDLIEADGKQTDSTVDGDPFPGTSNKSDFTATTTPAFKNWNNKTSSLPITKITESDSGLLSFHVNGGGDESSKYYCVAPAFEATGVTPNSITIAWENKIANASYILTVSRTYMDDDDYIISEVLPDYNSLNIGNVDHYEITGLDNQASYSINLSVITDNNIALGTSVRASTLPADFAYVRPSLTLNSVTDNSADISWVDINEADHYLVTVATRQEVEAGKSETIGFDNKKCPSDWIHSASWESRDAYVGQTAPALKFLIQDAFLQTGVYDEDITAVSFWARTQRENASLSFKVYSLDENKNLHLLKEITEVDGTSKGSNIVIDDIPEGVRQLLFVYNFSSEGLALNVDDIKLAFAGKYNDTPIADYDNLKVDANNLHIENLDADSDYVAYVKAHNGVKESAVSNIVKIHTQKPTGIEGIGGASAISFNVANGVITSAAPYSVYTVDGKVICLDKTGAFALPAKGIYIINSREKMHKICY